MRNLVMTLIVAAPLIGCAGVTVGIKVGGDRDHRERERVVERHEKHHNNRVRYPQNHRGRVIIVPRHETSRVIIVREHREQNVYFIFGHDWAMDLRRHSVSWNQFVRHLKWNVVESSTEDYMYFRDGFINSYGDNGEDVFNKGVRECRE